MDTRSLHITRIQGGSRVQVHRLAPKGAKVLSRPANIRSAFRKAKSEVVSRLLLSLWDLPPGTYDLQSRLGDAWHRAVTPLTFVGLDSTRSHHDRDSVLYS